MFQKPIPGSDCLSIVCGWGCFSQLLFQYHACLPTALLPTMMVMNFHPEAVRRVQLNVFFCKLSWSWCLYSEKERSLRQIYKGSQWECLQRRQQKNWPYLAEQEFQPYIACYPHLWQVHLSAPVFSSPHFDKWICNILVCCYNYLIHISSPDLPLSFKKN